MLAGALFDVSRDAQVLGLLVCDEGLGQTGPVETVQQKPRLHPCPPFSLSLYKIAQNRFAGAEFFSLLLSCTHKASAPQGRTCQDHGLCREALP